MDFCLLSKFDDLFSDIFLDAQFLWFDTIKLNNDHRRPRIRSDKVLKIIQDNILTTGKTNEAVKELLQMDYFKHYLATKSTKEQQEFIQHMKRYLYMYMPNAGFEIADTRRYGGAGRRVEACVTVTKDWMLGDEMRLCTGMIAHLEPHQEHELKKGNRDISVMWSTRKQCNCLFLGPARFVNHDCDPNAKFISLGHNSITFKIIKDIKCGEELTAFYGKHYFGENNCECRCATCETRRTGYFTPETEDSDLIGDNEDDSTHTSRSRKRKSGLYDDYLADQSRRNKRTSLDMSRTSQIDLEQLIGILTDDDDGDDDLDDKYGENNNNSNITTIIKKSDIHGINTSLKDIKEQVLDEDEEERPQVMSIHFLCNDDDKKQQQQQQMDSPSSRSASDSPLDILCNAVLDAEYLKIQPKQEEITVVVSPEIHRDATDRVRRKSDIARWNSLDEDNDTKADSAVGLSPQQIERTTPTSTIKTATSSKSTKTKKASTTKWQNDLDSLFDDEQLSELDDFMDDVSDLSSVCSSDLSLDSDIDSDEDKLLQQLSTPSPSPGTTNTKKTGSLSTGSNNHNDGKSELNCVACGRALKPEPISDPSAVDVAVANELATWTWSPSAAFTDWRPQRCPRCERHVRVFAQEWPARKIKKKAIVPASTNGRSTNKMDTSKKRIPKKKRKKSSTFKHTKPTSATAVVTVSNKHFIRSPPTPTSEIFDGVDDIF